MEYIIHLLILCGIYIILAQGLNMPFGVGRLFNLAHIATYAIGAYTTALFSTELGFSFLPCIFLSALLAGLFSFLIGAISLKLSDDYFAIGTIAFSSLVSALLINWKSLTKGVLGIPGIPRPEIFGVNFYENINFLILVFVFVIFTQLLLYIFLKNHYGRSLRALAEFAPAAAMLGINVRWAKLLSFVIASTAAGVSGSFFAYYINYIDPSSFSLTEMIFVLTIVVVGKPGSFWGVIGSTFFLILLPEPLRFIEIPPSILGPMRQMLYAIILYIVVLWKRETLFPVERSI